MNNFSCKTSSKLEFSFELLERAETLLLELEKIRRVSCLTSIDAKEI
jgi:hypothetical protein